MRSGFSNKTSSCGSTVPRLTEGEGAPVGTPNTQGDLYLDTTTPTVYRATYVAGVLTWVELVAT